MSPRIGVSWLSPIRRPCGDSFEEIWEVQILPLQPLVWIVEFASQLPDIFDERLLVVHLIVIHGVSMSDPAPSGNRLFVLPQAAP